MVPKLQLVKELELNKIFSKKPHKTKKKEIEVIQLGFLPDYIAKMISETAENKNRDSQLLALSQYRGYINSRNAFLDKLNHNGEKSITESEYLDNQYHFALVEKAIIRDNAYFRLRK